MIVGDGCRVVANMIIMHETITVETVKAEVGGYPHIAILILAHAGNKTVG